VVFRLDLAVIVAAIAGAALWIEHGHHVNIETPPGAAFIASVGAACPDNDNVPYSARCLAFLTGATEIGMRWRIRAEERPTVMHAEESTTSLTSPTVCPANDTVPYNARCLAFLTGRSSPH
jgi:hypothetical protein